MSYEAKSFIEAVQARLKQGKSAFVYVLGAYNWSNVHLKEIHKYFPKFRRQWLADQIQQIFNVNAEQCVRVAHQIGGSRDDDSFVKGIAFIGRFGVYESMRAYRLLNRGQLEQLKDKVPANADVNAFRQIVDEMAEVMKTKAGLISPSDKIDYRREFFKLQKENTELRVQLKAAQSELKVLREWKDSMVGAK